MGQNNPNDNCKSSDIEMSYKCAIGMTLFEFLRQIRLDTSAIKIVEEPPAVIKGIRITVGDSLMIRIYTGGPLLTDSLGKKRFSQKSDLSLIIEKKIRGIIWAVYKNEIILRKGSAGEVVWYWGD
jgi:hypothetical protein